MSSDRFRKTEKVCVENNSRILRTVHTCSLYIILYPLRLSILILFDGSFTTLSAVYAHTSCFGTL